MAANKSMKQDVNAESRGARTLNLNRSFLRGTRSKFTPKHMTTGIIIFRKNAIGSFDHPSRACEIRSISKEKNMHETTCSLTFSRCERTKILSNQKQTSNGILIAEMIGISKVGRMTEMNTRIDNGSLIASLSSDEVIMKGLKYALLSGSIATKQSSPLKTRKEEIKRPSAIMERLPSKILKNDLDGPVYLLVFT